MLTAHQRIQIVRHLPEVVDAWQRTDRGFLALSLTRLNLADGGQIVISRHGYRLRARRYRIVGDYSDRPELLPITADMRKRLARVFGPLDFGDDA